MVLSDDIKLNGDVIILNGGISHSIELHIDRPVYKQEKLNETTYYKKPKTNFKDLVKTELNKCSVSKSINSVLPVVKWLPKYDWKKNFLADVFSGMTIAVLHIPQGMAYGLLGNVAPVVGMYMAFFPVLMYFFLGTSRHVSIGTFAIVCLMTGRVVTEHATSEYVMTDVSNMTDTGQYSNMDVAVTVTFTVAILQFAMYFFRLGIVANLLSETLVNGFTTAAACQVVASQLKDLLGLPTKKRRGYFSLPLTLLDSLLALPQGNRTAISISFVAIILMVLNNEILKQWLSQKTKMPIPIELIAVVVGTLVSYFLDLSNVYDVTTIGVIPTGLPAPKLPTFSLIPTIFVDCIIITIVSYSVTISMAFIFAHKSRYNVNANQELLAMGGSNLFGSFFSCMPIAASLSRSHIQHSVGGVSQIASVVSAFIIMVILLFLGPLFQFLPRCILASVIVVALKGMLFQCTELPKFYHLSRWDSFVWICTFLPTAFIAIDVGLLVGIVVSLASLFLRGHQPYTCLLGNLPGTDLYLDTERYKGVQEIGGIKIFHYCGALNFASKAQFKKLIYEGTGVKPSKVLEKMNSSQEEKNSNERNLLLNDLKCLVMDFSALSYIDPTCVDVLCDLVAEFRDVEVQVYIAGCSGPVYETFCKCARYQKKKYNFVIFPTIHDAVLYGRRNLLEKL